MTFTVEQTLSLNYVSSAKEDGSVIDGIVVDGRANEDLFVKSFWLGSQCELLKYGSSRIDYLLEQRTNRFLIEQLRERIGVEHDTFLVLYAPTFRDNGSTKGYIRSYSNIRKAFAKKYGNITFAVRLHPNAVSNGLIVPSLDKGIINLSSYADVDELVLAADCLITDYSSIAYDFAIINKPVFLFASDLGEYEQIRGFSSLFYEQPFVINTTEEELIEEIINRSKEEYEIALASFFEKYPLYNDRKSASNTVDWLVEKGLRKKRINGEKQ